MRIYVDKLSLATLTVAVLLVSAAGPRLHVLMRCNCDALLFWQQFTATNTFRTGDHRVDERPEDPSPDTPQHTCVVQRLLTGWGCLPTSNLIAPLRRQVAFVRLAPTGSFRVELTDIVQPRAPPVSTVC